MSKGYSDDPFLADWERASDHEFVLQIDRHGNELERRSRCFDQMLEAMKVALTRIGAEDDESNRLDGPGNYTMSDPWHKLLNAIAEAEKGAPKRKQDWALPGVAG